MIDLFSKYLSNEESQYPEPLLSFYESNIDLDITLVGTGENNYIIGKPKTGKSQFAAFFISEMINEKVGKLEKFEKDIITILIDTEQGEGQINKIYIQNIFRNRDREELIRENKNKQYKIFSIKNEPDKLNAALSIINTIKSEYPDKHLFIVIDNLTSLVKNINDSDNSTIDKLTQAREDNTMLLLLHSNHKNSSYDDEGTGHIGTQAKRNASIIWNSLKEKDGKYLLKCQVSRYHNDTNEICFEFIQKSNDDLYYFDQFELLDNKLSQINNSAKAEKKSELKLEIDTILKQCEIHDKRRLKKNIVAEIMKKFKLKKSAAYRYTGQLIEEGIFIEDKGEMFFPAQF
jgi:KaiC/GvpD/RAD55 family RecA-like ATPase